MEATEGSRRLVGKCEVVKKKNEQENYSFNQRNKNVWGPHTLLHTSCWATRVDDDDDDDTVANLS